MSKLIRRYGYFECFNCGNKWESAHVYCYDFDPVYEQDCRECGEANMPDEVEKLQCSLCGKRGKCDCSRDFFEEDEDKPHRSDLCHKCQSGHPCT